VFYDLPIFKKEGALKDIYLQVDQWRGLLVTGAFMPFYREGRL
jgi:hypothetical protein